MARPAPTATARATARPKPIEFGELPLERRALAEVIVLPSAGASLPLGRPRGTVATVAELLAIAGVFLLLGYVFGCAIR